MGGRSQCLERDESFHVRGSTAPGAGLLLLQRGHSPAQRHASAGEAERRLVR
jgi:hypothetical protein